MQDQDNQRHIQDHHQPDQSHRQAPKKRSFHPKRVKMYLRMLTASLLRRKSRMLVALLAVAVGSTILSGLLTIYYDIPRQLEQEFRSYGANLILLPEEGSEGISQDTLDAVRALLPKEKTLGVAPYAYRNVQVNEQPYRVAITDLEEAHRNSPYWLIKGDFPKQAGDILLGSDIAKATGLAPGSSFNVSISQDDGTKKLHGEEVKKADGQIDVSLNRIERTYRVAGVLVTGGAEDRFIFMSHDDYVRLDAKFNSLYDVLECSVIGDEAQIDEAAHQIDQAKLGLLARPAKRLTASQDVVLEKLKNLIWLVTFIVLVLTMISVSTTMMAVITERRKEIALKKALGAESQGVVLEFLGEGLLLGFLGGVLGSVFGYLFARSVGEEVFARAIAFPWLLPPMTIVIAMLITVLACLYPVRQTLDVKPALVLKGE